MSITAKSYFNPKNLCTVEDVLVSLDLEGHELPLSELERLNGLNQLYLIISRNIRLEIQRGGFDYPEFTDRFDLRLTHHYLRVLQGYLLSTDIAPAWQKAFDSALDHTARPMITMARGLHAHINKNIPQALRDCRADQRQFRDFRRIIAIVAASLDEIISSFDQTDRSLHPRQHHILRQHPLRRANLQYLLTLWRYTAWHNFNKMMRYQTGVVVIGHSSRHSGGVSKLPL